MFRPLFETIRVDYHRDLKELRLASLGCLRKLRLDEWLCRHNRGLVLNSFWNLLMKGYCRSLYGSIMSICRFVVWRRACLGCFSIWITIMSFFTFFKAISVLVILDDWFKFETIRMHLFWVFVNNNFTCHLSLPFVNFKTNSLYNQGSDSRFDLWKWNFHPLST